MKKENEKHSSTHFLSEEEIKHLSRPTPTPRKALFRQIVLSVIIFLFILILIYSF